MNGRPADSEDVTQLGDAVLTRVVELDEVSSLRRLELGLLASEVSLGPGDLQTFAGSHADEIGLELGHHRQNIEQQATDRVGGVMDRSADADADAAFGQLIENLAGIGDGPSKSV